MAPAGSAIQPDATTFVEIGVASWTFQHREGKRGIFLLGHEPLKDVTNLSELHLVEEIADGRRTALVEIERMSRGREQQIQTRTP